MNTTIKQVSRTKAKTNSRQIPASAKKFAAQMGLDMKGLEAEAADIWKMLDEMATEKPIEYQSFIDQQLQQSKEEAEADKGRYLRPHAGFCVHSHTTGGDGIKVRTSPDHGKELYINFCSHEAIQAPRDRNDREVLDDRELANDLSIPMLVGVPRDASESVIAVDILYHPVVIARCDQHVTFRQQIIELGSEWVSQETKLRFKPPTVISAAYMCGRGTDKSVPALFYVDPSVVEGEAQPNTKKPSSAPITSPNQVLESIHAAQGAADVTIMDKSPNISVSPPQVTTGKASHVMIQELSQGKGDEEMQEKVEKTEPTKKSNQFDIKESKTTKKKPSAPLIKKGFLNNCDKMQLYPEGKSSEGHSGGAYARLMEKCIVVNPDGSTNKSGSVRVTSPKASISSDLKPAPPKSTPRPNQLEMKEIDNLFASVDEDWGADHSNHIRKSKEEEDAMTSQLSSLAKALCGSDCKTPPSANADDSAVSSIPPPFVISHSTMDMGMLVCSEMTEYNGKSCIHLSFANLASDKLSTVDIQVSAKCIRICVPNMNGEIRQISIDTRNVCDIANVKAKMSKKKGTVDAYIPVN